MDELLLGLWMYMEEAGSHRALLLLLLWLSLLAADWTLMVRSVRRRDRRLRRRAYGLTALSLTAALAVHWAVEAFGGGPPGYAPGYWDPVWETFPSALAAITYGATLFAFLCWGYCQRCRELTEER